jgi:hypothetical protein
LKQNGFINHPVVTVKPVILAIRDRLAEHNFTTALWSRISHVCKLSPPSRDARYAPTDADAAASVDRSRLLPAAAADEPAAAAADCDLTGATTLARERRAVTRVLEGPRCVEPA